jgi:hypothetical protein
MITANLQFNLVREHHVCARPTAARRADTKEYNGGLLQDLDWTFPCGAPYKDNAGLDKAGVDETKIALAAIVLFIAGVVRW